MVQSDTSIAINSVLNFLGKATDVKKPISNAVPTAKVRASLNLLASGSVESLITDQVNLRTVAEGLFNWSDKPKVSKNVIRAMNEALNEPGKYAAAVELCGYLAAWAPMLEPDRIARLFSLVKKTNTSFAPANYTLQLNQKLTKVFGGFNPERQEKLAASLWEQAHNGRWWDLTTGEGFIDLNEVQAVADNLTVKQIEIKIIENDLAWSNQVANLLPQVKVNEKIRNVIEAYSIDLIKGKIVDPDIALISSYLPWLKINERPESPIGSLVSMLISIVEDIDWNFPEKPQKFSDLFPNVRFYGNGGFPFATNIYATDGINAQGVRFELVKSPTELAENRTYMGNCTWSYKTNMEQGTYVLYRLHYQNQIYNAAMTTNNRGQWNLREINSRHNRGQVPAVVNEMFRQFIRQIDFNEPETTHRVGLYKEASGDKNKKQTYKFKV